MAQTVENHRLSAIAFYASIGVLLFVAVLYFYNIFQWAGYPDFGYGFRSAWGIKIIGVVTRNGEKAGLQIGDEILEINGHRYNTIEELRRNMNRELGADNTYLLDRNGRTFAVTLENNPTGFKQSFVKSGFSYLLGLCYFVVGIVVFLMKPHHRSSWIFHLFTAVFGIYLIFIWQLGASKPPWFENFNIFAYCFTPAVFIHLSIGFPEERQIKIRYPYIQAAPYIIALILFILVRLETTVMAYAPKPWLIAVLVYMVLGVTIFLGSCLHHSIRSTSQIVKKRATMILLGFGIAASLPILDYLINALFNIYIFPSFNWYLPFFIVFPVFIGYSIVKHDLFNFDTIIKRTYGYVLTTAALAGVYGLFVLVSNLLFGQFDIVKLHFFPIVFMLAVVLLFNTIRDRAQRLIDRMFYRLEYSYKETVEQISETMRSLMDMDQIGKNIMHFALAPMFVDAGSVMVLNKNKTSYDCLIQSGDMEEDSNHPADVERHAIEHTPMASPIECSVLLPEEPLMKNMAQRKKTTTIYDIWEDPFFEENRDACVKTFNQLGATLVVPLIYEDQLTGIIALGKKKSGKFYQPDDINLFNTLANQGAVAIENARMLEEIVEKERAKAKLMEVFGKYVTDEIRDQILHGQIPLDGENKDVTLLFADLRGFTTLAESTPPKVVVKIINSYFSGMAKAIRENQGIVLQFIGDEIEAAFGAPLPLEDHPTHAVRAALAMQEQLISVNHSLVEEGYEPLRHGIGVHTGKAVAANIGSEDRMSYALVGDTVNLASRIQGLNKAFGTEILISATTVKRLAEEYKLEKLPTTTVKGKKDSVEIYKFV